MLLQFDRNPARVLSRLNDQFHNLVLDCRPARIPALSGTIELLGDEPAVPREYGSGLATQATCSRPLRPSRLPISASVHLSGSDKHNRVGRCARRMRFFAAT